MKSRLLGAVCACLSITFLSFPVLASTLVFSGGKITGLDNLQVGGGISWDVSFVDGTCLSVDPNCMVVGNLDNARYGRLVDDLSSLFAYTYDKNDFAAYSSNVGGGFAIWVMNNSDPSITPSVRGINISDVVANPVSEFGALQNIDPNANQDALFSNYQGVFARFTEVTTSPVPVPAAVWLFGSGLLGLIGIARRKA